MVQFQHTATRRWLPAIESGRFHHDGFQHTATRRWLQAVQALAKVREPSFNTQPPEGGCFEMATSTNDFDFSFNTQPPEGGCLRHLMIPINS